MQFKTYIKIFVKNQSDFEIYLESISDVLKCHDSSDLAILLKAWVKHSIMAELNKLTSYS